MKDFLTMITEPDIKMYSDTRVSENIFLFFQDIEKMIIINARSYKLNTNVSNMYPIPTAVLLLCFYFFSLSPVICVPSALALNYHETNIFGLHTAYSMSANNYLGL